MKKKLYRSIVKVYIVLSALLLIISASCISLSKVMGFPPPNVKMVMIDKIQKMDDDYVTEILIGDYDGYEMLTDPPNVEFWDSTDNPERIASIMAAVKLVRITEPYDFYGIPSFLGFKCKNGKIYTIELYRDRETKEVYGLGYEDPTGKLYEELANACLIAGGKE